MQLLCHAAWLRFRIPPLVTIIAFVVFQSAVATQTDCTDWSKHITTYPPQWYEFSDPNTPMTPMEYIEKVKPECRHCVWSLGYPLAIPALMTISPKQDESVAPFGTCDFLTGQGEFSLCYLDCTKWDQDMDILSKDGNQHLNMTELAAYFSDSDVAPPQNYKLYTGGGRSYNPALSRLDPKVVFSSIDLDKNNLISRDEWRVFRHFWTPTVVSRAGPSKVPEDGRPLADGPLGGFFVDGYFMQIWFKNMVNIMLEYYISNMDRGYRMIDVREPVSMEKLSILREMDLDGSERISNEETYFRLFADGNHDGQLDATEYCKSLYESTLTEDQCDVSNAVNAESNFELHDLDGNKRISFLERKFVASDLNYDRMIDADEWRVGDFPEIYGPFEGHCAEQETRNGGVACELDSSRYNYYMSFHYCASQGALAYNKPISAHPWSEQCELLVQVEDSGPFVQVYHDEDGPLLKDNGDLDTAKMAELRGKGWLCWEGKDPEDAFVSEEELKHRCFSGYAIKIFDDIASRLQWTYRPVLASGKLSTELLKEPDTKKGADKAVFNLALFSSYQEPWNPPDKVYCSTALWKEDGLVVVKRLKDTETSIELAILAMIIDPSFVNFVVFCYFVVLVIGHIFWYIESGENELFDKSYTRGIMDGLWFSMVTVTTVGYGDIAPITGPGKCLTILWMFFGILCFGVFSGSVSDQINTAAAENSITGVSDLSTFSVGVLSRLAEPVVPGWNFGADFNFDQVICNDIADCEDKLVNEKSISAMIVPHSDVLAYLHQTEHQKKECGEKMMIVGGNFSTESTAKWTGATVKMCSYSQSVYAAKYLANAVSDQINELLEDGTADDLQAELLTWEDEADDCGPSSGYNIELIIATLCVVVFYFLLIKLMGWYRKRNAMAEASKHLEVARVYARRWITNFNIARRTKMAEKRRDAIEKVKEIAAHDHVMHMVKRLRNMYMQQATEIRNINHDTKTAHERVNRLMTFMSVVGTLLVITLFSVTIAMLVVWGKLVRLTYL